MEKHIKILGILHIVKGGLYLLGALVIFLVSGGVTGLVGWFGEGSDAAVAIPILGLIGAGLTILLIVLSVPSILAGWGLLNFRNWARILTIVLSVLDLFNIGLGTVLGIYGLWVLLPTETEALFRTGQARVAVA